MAERYAHIDFKPPQGAREAARRALEVRAEKPESERGMTPVGIARARDLSAGKTLSPETVRRMLSFFERHEGDKSGSTWDAQGKGWQAWHGWGGDAGFAWARKVVRQLDAADAAGKRMNADASADGDPGVAVVLPIDEETAEYALPGVADAHVTLAYLGRLSALPMGALAVARSVVAAWASQTPAMAARFSGVGRFHGDDGETDAVYLSVDAPGLTAARDALCRALRATGLPVSSEHGFTPHATLAYVPRDASTPDAPADLPLALTLDAAAVWCGPADHDVPVALTGTQDPKTMTDSLRFRGDSTAITCAETADVGSRTWNQIARKGEFNGHPQGPFRFDARTFAEILRNFRATKNRRVQVDFEHASEMHPENVATEGVPALAWVVDIEERADGTLWGLFEWVAAKAVEYVRSGMYRYLSPAVQFAARDKVSGEPIGARLTSVALTNKPFLDGMAPVTASEGTTTTASLTPGDVHIPALTGAQRRNNTMASKGPEKVGEAMSEEEIADLKAMKTKMADAERRMAEMDVAAADAAKMQAEYASLRERHMAMCARLREMAELGPEEAEDAALEKIAGQVAEMKRIQRAEAEQLSDRAISAHGLSESRRDKLIAHAMRDRADFLDAYPKAAAPAAEPVKVASENAAPPSAESLRQPAPADANTRALLSEQVAVTDPHPTPIANDGTIAERSAAREALAARLMSEGRAKNHAEAAMLADRTLTQQRAARAVAPFVGA